MCQFYNYVSIFAAMDRDLRSNIRTPKFITMGGLCRKHRLSFTFRHGDTMSISMESWNYECSFERLTITYRALPGEGEKTFFMFIGEQRMH